MRRGGYLEPVDGFQCDIQGTVDTDSDFRAAQIVVDGGGHADHRKSLLPKCPGSGLRAVSTDHNERIDVALMKNLDGFPLGLFLLELFATPAAQKGSASLDDIAYVAEPEAGRNRLPADRHTRAARRRFPSPSIPVRTTARTAAFMPGASPPLVIPRCVSFRLSSE